MSNEKEYIVLGQKSTNWLLQSHACTKSMKRAKITKDRKGRKILKEWMIEDGSNQGIEQGVTEDEQDQVNVRIGCVDTLGKEKEWDQQNSQCESDEEEETETDDELEHAEKENENDTARDSPKSKEDGDIEAEGNEEATSMEKEINNNNDKGNGELQSQQEMETENGESQCDQNALGGQI